MHQQLVTAFANGFTNGDNFASITSARKLAQSVLNQKIEPGTPGAKIVDESIEQGLVLAARRLVQQSKKPLEIWEQCLDLYNRQPALNTRTSTSILQQAYSTPVPIAYLAGTLAQIDRTKTVYEPTAGNGALLLLANPELAIVNELNSNRAAALRTQGFTVTEQDASSFSPSVESVDRIITNPPFSSLKDAQGQTRMFQRGQLTTSKLDHAIALSALDLMKADGRAVLILGGKMGNESSRTERYNTQLTRGFYRWLYKDAGYKVTDHFSLDGSLYRKQGTTFPVDMIVIEGRGETQLKLPGIQPPRIYESYEDLKEVLIYATKQQLVQSPRDTGIALRGVYSGQAVDTNISDRPSAGMSLDLDDSVSASISQSDRESGGVFSSVSEEDRTPNLSSGSTLADRIRTSEGQRSGIPDSNADQRVYADISEQSRFKSNSSRDGNILGANLSGIAGVMSTGSPYVSSGSSSSNGDESFLHKRHEFDRLVDVDEHRRKPTLFSGLEVMAELSHTPEESLVVRQVDVGLVKWKRISNWQSIYAMSPVWSG